MLLVWFLDIDFLVTSRVKNLTAHVGSAKIRNLALCEPERLTMGRWLKHTPSEQYSLFFLTGMALFSSLLSAPTNRDSRASQQIGVVPFSASWYRLVAILGRVFAATHLFFSTFNGVLTISTKTAPVGQGECTADMTYARDIW